MYIYTHTIVWLILQDCTSKSGPSPGDCSAWISPSALQPIASRPSRRGNELVVTDSFNSWGRHKTRRTYRVLAENDVVSVEKSGKFCKLMETLQNCNRPVWPPKQTKHQAGICGITFLAIEVAVETRQAIGLGDQSISPQTFALHMS